MHTLGSCTPESSANVTHPHGSLKSETPGVHGSRNDSTNERSERLTICVDEEFNKGPEP